MVKRSIIWLGLFFVSLADSAGFAQRVVLATHGKAVVSVVVSDGGSVAQAFAAGELAGYLRKISGATFTVRSGPAASTPGSIFLEKDRSLAEEDYGITVRGAVIRLSGGTDRAVLYAVYDLLHRLGCVWMAPNFSFYKPGASEYVPHRAELVYLAGGDVQEHPVFRYRKLDVEEGLTHTIANLREMVEWMPKLRYNVLQVPLNYGGWGRVKWDTWRETLTPEMKKRGLLIEVGGHGYQNFLSAAMEDSTLFKEHPDWFGRDKNCQPTPDEYAVFNTANPEAVTYLVGSVVKYIRQHPEIDIFDFWPPDMARWAECPSSSTPGSPLDRQARLINTVDSAVHRVKPGLRMEMIAYQPVLLPPGKVTLNRGILVDFCPINQSFERPIYDSPAVNNPEYVRVLRQWRSVFAGDIGLYSYYRKYGWRSLPNIIPHYMQSDLRWYARIPLQGISSYAEPGDWATYELNHYILGGLAWNPEAPVDPIMEQFALLRYGPAKEIALGAYRDLEEVVRNYCSIPYTAVKSGEQIDKAVSILRNRKEQVDAVLGGGAVKSVAANLKRLSLMLEYAIDDLDLTRMRVSGIAGPELADKVKQLVDFLERHAGEGLFVLHDKGNVTTFLKHYNSIH